jgi:hypothetical protein
MEGHHRRPSDASRQIDNEFLTRDTGMHLDPAAAMRAVHAYNSDSYRGRPNLVVDREAYDRFRGGLPEDDAALIDSIRFVGEDYGGAQRRFLPHGYCEEAALIVNHLRPIRTRWNSALRSAAPISTSAPDEALLSCLLAPFFGTKKWPVWATKTLHFLRPDAYPVLDSRAKAALGMRSLGSTPRDYRRFCITFRETLLNNEAALEAARNVDGGTSPSDLKLLDKILYQLGRRQRCSGQ